MKYTKKKLIPPPKRDQKAVVIKEEVGELLPISSERLNLIIDHYKEEDDNYYVVWGSYKDTEIVTGSMSLEKTYDLIADALKCADDVKVSWWNRMLNKLKRYGKSNS